VRCPWCGGLDDRVVDSREIEEGAAVRRRRECGDCHRRFTTYERSGDPSLLVVKRSGEREPFDRQKLMRGVRASLKNRPVGDEELEELASAVEEALRGQGREVASELVGVAVLDRLRDLDEVGYVRFASVYKGFEDLGDFQREVGMLTKRTEPKHH
jgi:transcriptional repressor NrdR